MQISTKKISYTEQVTPLFHQSLEKLNQGSSPLLNRMREVSIKRFAQTGIPDFRNEDYKYTNLKPVFEKTYTQELQRESGIINLNEMYKNTIAYLDPQLVFLVNGWF